MSKIRNINEGQNGPKEGVEFDLNSADDIRCSNCGCKVFEAAFMFKKVSALLSPTGQASMIPIQTFRCSECGNIEPEFLPAE